MSRIALIGENSVEYASALLDIWNNGDSAVLLDWRIPFDTAYRMMLEANVRECFIDKRLLKNKDHMESSSVVFHPYDVSDDSAHVLPNNVRKKYQINKSQDEAVIFYSSGTTGKSKGIILSHNAITTNADSILDYVKSTCSDCLYIAKSLSHSSTLVSEFLVALRSGANMVLAPTVVPPRYVLSRISEYSITTLCLNPTLLQMYAEEQEKKKYDLSSLKKIYCSGSILNDRVYAKAHKVFDEIGVYNVYGLSEAGPRVTAQTADCCKGNSVGKPIKGVDIVIVDEKGDPVRQGERGIIYVNTPSRFSGYISGKRKYPFHYRDWLNTEDVGFIDGYGELHIVGRIDDVIIIDAHKVYPLDVERLILEDGQISSCVVCGCVVDGIPMIGCLYVSDSDCTLELVHRLKKTLMQYEIPKRFVRVNSIPRNPNGKVNRCEVGRLLSDYSSERIVSNG